MATEINGLVKTFLAGAAITRNSLVAYDTNGEVKECGSSGTPIGVCILEAADGDYVPVALKNAGGTNKVNVASASASVTYNTTLYTAADGDVTATTTGTSVGYCLSAQTAGTVEMLWL